MSSKMIPIRRLADQNDIVFTFLFRILYHPERIAIPELVEGRDINVLLEFSFNENLLETDNGETNEIIKTDEIFLQRIQNKKRQVLQSTFVILSFTYENLYSPESNPNQFYIVLTFDQP